MMAMAISSDKMPSGAPHRDAAAEEALEALCREAVSRLGPACLWWADRAKVAPATIVRALRDYGGHEGMRFAGRIEEAMRAADRLSVRGASLARP
jgi:hypothetical protein